MMPWFISSARQFQQVRDIAQLVATVLWKASDPIDAAEVTPEDTRGSTWWRLTPWGWPRPRQT